MSIAHSRHPPTPNHPPEKIDKMTKRIVAVLPLIKHDFHAFSLDGAVLNLRKLFLFTKRIEPDTTSLLSPPRRVTYTSLLWGRGPLGDREPKNLRADALHYVIGWLPYYRLGLCRGRGYRSSP